MEQQKITDELDGKNKLYWLMEMVFLDETNNK